MFSGHFSLLVTARPTRDLPKGDLTMRTLPSPTAHSGYDFKLALRPPTGGMGRQRTATVDCADASGERMEPTAALAYTGVPHWLFGGWAVDFFVGVLTRPHNDGEFVVWKRDLPRLRQLFEMHGYHPAFVHEDASGWRKDGVLVAVYWIKRDEQGQVVTPGSWSDWPEPDDAFTSPPGRLGGLACPIISGQAQLETKEGYAAHRDRRPPRPKDLADMERLHAAMAGRAFRRPR